MEKTKKTMTKEEVLKRLAALKSVAEMDALAARRSNANLCSQLSGASYAYGLAIGLVRDIGKRVEE